MAGRVLQLVLQYDGSDFAGWQVQTSERTVHGGMEGALTRLCDHPVRVTGAGCGARGQQPPGRCSATFAGYRFIGPVGAPNAPWTQTQPGVGVAHHGDAAAPRRFRAAIQLATASKVISAPTAVAR